MASVLVKVFKRLFLLNRRIEVVHTCTDVRYTQTHMNDLEVLTDLEKKYVKVYG